MANPMQKKSRRSFIIGVLVAVILMGIVVAFLLVQISKLKQEEAARLESQKKIYALNVNVKSGQLITQNMLKQIDIDQAVIPSNAVQNVDQYYLEDQYGNTVQTVKENQVKLTKTIGLNEDEEQSNNENLVTVVNMYDQQYIIENLSGDTGEVRVTLDQDGNIVQSIKEIEQDEDGEEVVRIETYVLINGEQHAIENLNNNVGTTEINGQTVSITMHEEVRQVILEGLPVMAKIDMNKNTILTSDAISESFEIVNGSTRKQEYNMIAVPADIETDDIVDIRLRTPTGTDYIVVSKKRVSILELGTTSSVNTIYLDLSEEETLLMSNAIVEAYIMEGSRLYLTRYVEAGMQEASIPTYIPSNAVINLIGSNPNIVDEAKNALIVKYNENYTQARGDIEGSMSLLETDEKQEAVGEGITEEITKAQEERESYLDALAGASAQ